MLRYSLSAVSALELSIYGIAGAIALIAFAVGFARGFRRTSWGACCWAFAALCWLLYETKIRPAGEPGLLGLDGWKASLVSLIVCIAITFLLVGVIAALVRIKRKPVEVVDDDEPHKIIKYKPRFIDRLLGGFVSLFNCVIVIVVLAMVAAVIIPAYTHRFDNLFTSSLVSKLQPRIQRFALDLLFSAVIMGIAYGGWKAGFLNGFSAVIHTMGLLVGVAVLMILPFKSTGFIANMNTFFAEGIGNFTTRFSRGRSLIERFLPTISKFATGVSLSALFVVFFCLFCKLLEIVEDHTQNSAPIRFVNGLLGIVAGIAQALLLLGIVIGTLALFQYFGANVPFDAWISDNSVFSGKLMQVIKNVLENILDKFRGGTLI